MSINKLISIKAPILEAFGDMGIDHTKNYPDFVRWAVRAEREIGSYFSLKKLVKPLKVNRFRAELPCEAMYAQRVLLGDYSKFPDLFNMECLGVPKPNIIIDPMISTFLVIDNPLMPGGRELTPYELKWQVQDNHIVLNQDYHDKIITVQYLGLELDVDGLPRVDENHMEAIIAHIKWKYAGRSRFSPVKMELGDVAMLRGEWATLCAEARAMDDIVSESDHDDCVRLLHDAFSGFGFEVGMHNRKW